MRTSQKCTQKLARSTNIGVDDSVNTIKPFKPVDLKMLGPLDQPQGQRSHILDGSDGPFGGKI